MAFSECCLKGFKWNGVPTGREETLSGLNTYVAGSDPRAAILLIHDAFGWGFVNNRLLADHYAAEAQATVYMPDFFDGEVLDSGLLADGKFDQIDLPGFTKRNSKEIREPAIFACAKELRQKYPKCGAIGFCFGGWAVFRLGAKENNNLVDAISTGHPTWLTKEEIENVGVPVQIVAPEHDTTFTPELKEFANRVIPGLGVPYDYQYFPGLEHGFATRGKEEDKAGMIRAKNAAVHWFQQWLHSAEA